MRNYLRTALQGAAALGAIAMGLAGCNAFNPAFLGIVAPNLAATNASIPNAPGYVVVALQNNVRIDGQLLQWLNDKIALPPSQLDNIRARIRMRLRITHADGTFQTVEMISGSGDFVDPDFDAQAVPDLERNTLTNVVVRCDVSSIQLEPNTNIEVFIPAPLEVWELTEVTVGNETNVVPVQRGTIAPQFRALQVDDVDQDGNVILQRNIDPRDVLSPTTNVVCGSVIPVVVNGVLSVPFFQQAGTNNPSYDQDDVNTVARIGGRYQFRVSSL